MNEVLNFEYNGSGFRTVMVDGEPWFVVYDICVAFGMKPNSGHDLVKRMSKDQYDSIVLVDRLGRRKRFLAVNESGLYNIILRSDKPQAKPFQNWVTKEVLPTLRKTGKFEIVKSGCSASELSTEFTRLTDLFQVWLRCSDMPYSRSVLKAVSEMAKDFAEKAETI